MRLYNVTFNISDQRHVLRPAIPESAADGENKTYPRVCLTDSVEHCIQAIAVGNRDVRTGTRIVVRSVDIRDLDRDKLLTPQQLFERKLVPDALENNEYWCLDTVRFKVGTYVIEDFDSEIDLAWSCISLEDCKRIVNKWMPQLKIGKFKIPKNLYTHAMQVADKFQMWDAQDGIWDDLAELNWAQKREIRNIKIRKVNF